MILRLPRQGFTLIEMAFTLILIGLFVGGILAITTTDINKSNTNQTLRLIGGPQEGIGQIENALILFASRNARLPCPADGSITSSGTNSAYYGLENGTANAALPTTGAACAVSLNNSVIPWRTLGLDEGQSLDGWGHRIAYYPANRQIAGVDSLADNGGNCLQQTTSGGSTKSCYPSQTTAVLATYMPFGNYIAVYDIASNACGTEVTLPNADNSSCPFGFSGTNCATVNTGSTDSCSSVSAAVSNPTTPGTGASNIQYNGYRAAYVLISHGRSGWYGWTRGGTQISPPATTYRLKNYNGGAATVAQAGTAGNLGFVQGATLANWPATNTNYFDDLVSWRTPHFIIERCGTGSCGNY